MAESTSGFRLTVRETSMRILFLVNSFNAGGLEQLMLEVFRGLREDGIDIETCCLRSEGALAPELRRIGITVRSGFLRHKYDLLAPLRIRRRYGGERFDLLFTEPGRNALMVGSYLKRALGIPKQISAIHATRKWGQRKMFRKSQLKILRGLDGVILCAETQRKYLISKEGLPPDNLTVIFNGVDHERFRPRPRAPGTGPKRVGIVASLTPEKGHEVFVEAAAKALGEQPGTEFLIIGDGPERHRIEGIIDALDVGANVKLLGIRRNMPELLSGLDLLALSSHPFREPLPISVMEAMACGLPTVTTDVGSLRDLVVHEETGILVPPGNPDPMAEAFVRILKDDALASRMGTAARRRIEESFTLTRAVGEYAAYFRNLAGPSPA